MEQLNWWFVGLDIMFGLAVIFRGVRYHNWGVVGIALVYLFLRIPYTLGNTEFDDHFIFWRGYELTVLAVIWFEMGKRRAM